MPRKIVIDDDMPMPRRRRRSKDMAIEADAEHGFLLRAFLHSPKDIIAGVLAFIAVSAIVANALFMQAGRHPAPMFGSITTLPAMASIPANPLPRPRPVEAAAQAPEIKPAEPRTADPLANLVKTTSTVQPSSMAIPRPPLAVPVSTRADNGPVAAGGSHRIAAIQRALAENGYGQVKPTGVVGPETQAAIQKFEKARKLPVTGQVSERLVRELAAMTGRSIE